jgi:hypothetical protein
MREAGCDFRKARRYRAQPGDRATAGERGLPWRLEQIGPLDLSERQIVGYSAGAKRSLKSNAAALAEVCKANDERTFARMRGNDVDAPKPDL